MIWRAFIAVLALAACNNMFSGTLKAVPPVHRVPIEAEGTVVLLAEDPIIESKDPVHIARARENHIPEDYRAAMTTALQLAGFKVVATADAPHTLVAKLALAVREEGNTVYQTYRCGLRGTDGAEVAQIDWAWPQGTYVDENEVFAYATHNVATEIATSRRVLAYLRGARGPATVTDGGAPQ